MSGKNKHRSANDYLQYLKGELSSKERHTFEKGLEADPFEQEAMEGLETLEPGQVEQDILYLHNRLRKRLSRRRRVAFYSVAATVASLLIVGTVFLKIHDYNPGSDEKQVYTEESFDPGTPPEAEAEEPVSPTPEKTQELPEKVPVKEIGPTRAVPEGEPKAGKVEVQDAEPAEPTEPTEAAEAEIYDYAMEENQITHLEAEPQAGAVENNAARTSQKSERRKKSRAQPVAQAPREISNEAVSQKELEQMLTGQVSGIVISAEDQGPIPGAIVENRALNSGVFTDLDGRFNIAVQEDTPTTLVASFIGMETQEYHVSDGEQVEMFLQPDVNTLDEVMVVGYVAQEEAFPTGSVYNIYEAEKKKGSDYTVPEPVIGTNNYKQYLEQNIEFPQVNTDLQRAIVVLKFMVTRNGEVKEVVALKSPGEAFTREAIRLLMEGPAWNPASTDGETKDESVRMRIVFKR